MTPEQNASLDSMHAQLNLTEEEDSSCARERAEDAADDSTEGHRGRDSQRKTRLSTTYASPPNLRTQGIVGSQQALDALSEIQQDFQ